MAGLNRTAKSGSDWTSSELLAFNISIEDVDVSTFFGIDQLPKVTISSIVLDNDRKPEHPISKDARLFFYYLDRANIREKAAVNDFALYLLKLLDFDDEERAIVMRKELTFDMCGNRVYAKPDLCVMRDYELVLMVQEEKVSYIEMYTSFLLLRAFNLKDIHPVPQLVADAIAAFVSNNQGQHKQESTPLFYKIPISNALVEAVSTAQYPAQPTVVQRLLPPVPDVDFYLDQGLNPLENRIIVLKCCEALKGLLVSYCSG
ncbi:hypothetical protein DL96DRAFT_1667921 [Flagelloscypha sp. PMI_526]|nr:hypothetical protein DL96DRAFT_1667921 [Flagelloscypha sp. PMI_526]